MSLYLKHLRPLNTLLLGLTFVLTMSAPLSAASASLTHEQQREQFLQAKKALKRGRMGEFHKLAEGLESYELYPYLRYWELEKKLSKQSDDSISEFLQSYADSPLADRLRGDWLGQLAKQGEWSRFLDFYRDEKGGRMQCLHARAQLGTGNTELAWGEAHTLWLTGRSQDDACDPLFAAWDKAGGISRELRWQRIALAMKRGNSDLARYLGKPLSAGDRGWIELWVKANGNSDLLFSDARLQRESAMARMIVISVLERLARRDHQQALEHWQALSGRLGYSAEQRDTIHRRIGLEFALDGDTEALAWFELLTPAGRDETSYTWAVRSALRNHDWEAGLHWLEQMPSELANKPTWLYWRGRHLEALGRAEEARPYYQMASHELGYYGFLASDRLSEPYSLDSQPISIDQSALAQVSANPGVRRAFELLQVELIPDARREWRHFIKPLNREQLVAASALANEWRWHDRALITLARADIFSDLEIRFPLVHTDKILSEAQTRDIDPAWVMAVARQESAFMADVRSSAGAMGLMQIMPKTGRMIARHLNTRLRSRYQLLSPETNIRFGAYYLRSVLDELDNNPVLATAAYNAGPHRVRRWYPESGSLSADIWVETVPFNETREYLRRVFAYTVFYESRLGRKTTRLSERMRPVLSRKLISANEAIGVVALSGS